MLTLAPESACDICAEGYNASSLPHSIPCGHTFCRQCLDKICAGLWSPRLPAACPMCREPFAAEHIRLIRIDVAPSASYFTPDTPSVGYPYSAHPYSGQYPLATVHRELGLGGRGVVREGDGEEARVREQARVLEERVSKAAQTRCTFEEVSALQREIEEWLQKELVRRPDNQHASLRLSAALLGAILVNGFAYTEAKKVAKGVEVSLKDKLETVELVKKRLEVELHRQRTQLNEKLLEVQSLKVEMSKLKGTPAPPPLNLAPVPPPTHASMPMPTLGSMPLGAGLAMRPATPAASTSSSSSTSPMRAGTPAPRAGTPGPHYSGYSHFPRQHTLSTSSSPSHSHQSSPTHASHSSSSAVSVRSISSAMGKASLASTTSHFPVAVPAREGRHERWLPPEDASPPTQRRAPSAGAHAYAGSYSAASGIQRPRTAGGWRS